MKKYLPLFIFCFIASIAKIHAETEGMIWRLTLDYQRYDGNHKPVLPYTLQAGESADSDGSMDGELGGFTLSVDRAGSHLVDGIDLSVHAGDLDGDATYLGTFAGTTNVESDVLDLELRARHNLGEFLDDHLHPYLFLGVAYRDVQTDERGTISYAPINLDLPIDRRIDSRTILLQPGIGTTLDTLLGNATIGLRAEATFQVGVLDVDATEGGSPDDGTVTGYRVFGAIYASVPLSESWSLYGQTGIFYQDWFDDYDELQPYQTLFVSLGVQYEF